MVVANDGGGQLVRDLLKRIRDAAPLLNENRSDYENAVKSIFDILQRAVGQLGEFELDISSNRIMMGEDDEVYKSEARTNNLAFDLFRQGLRRLTFRPGVDYDELEGLVRRFSECRSADQIDEDFVTMMWQDSSPHITIIAIDTFTEKIFMSEAEFIQQFRTVLDDIAPGLVEMDDDDEDDAEPRAMVRLDSREDVDRADVEQRKIRKALGADDSQGRGLFNTETTLGAHTNHLVHLCVCQALAERNALSNAELQGIWVRVLSSYLADADWQGFADAMRTVKTIFDVRDAFSPLILERLEKLRKVVMGRDMAEQVAEHLDPEHTDFTTWSRWFFHVAEELTAPTLLELVNGCGNVSGRDWLKDQLRRQGTSSLDPWAERMRDPNPGIVLEVIDVIMSSGLETQAKSLLVDAFKHPEGSVRTKAIEGLSEQYDLEIREALLPLLKDPEPTVRRAVLKRFVDVNDKSVVTYFAHSIKSGEFFSRGEDEQRELMESLVRLSGEKHLDLLKERLQLEETSGLSKLLKRGASGVTDNITRRAVISALGVMNTPAANALIREVKTRADLSLAAHCDVVIRLSQRASSDDDQEQFELSDEGPADEDLSIGEHRMGRHLLFTLDDLGYHDIEAKIAHAKSRRAAQSAVTQANEHRADAPPAPNAPQTGPSVVSVVATGMADLGPSPLLNHQDFLDVWDRRRLVAAPAVLSGERFQVVDVDLGLIGVSQQTMDVRQRAKTTLPPPRIIERSRSPRRAEPQSPEQVDDLLQAYLGGSGDAPAAFGESTPESTPDMNSLLKDYLDESQEASSADHDVGHDARYPDAPAPQILAEEVRVENTDRTNDPKDDKGNGAGEAAQPGGEDALSDLLKAYVEAEPEK
ncbi:MAG: HEAT repeat domain-containing protein [Myxococcota bacterium]|nr:HEAT repeat domain-containing protein [Myxococcota bacterium]